MARKIKVVIDSLTYDLDGTIDEAIARLQKIKEDYSELGPISLSWEDHSPDPYNPQYALQVLLERDETPEEEAARIRAEQEYQRQVDEHDFAEYLRLNAKFGKG